MSRQNNLFGNTNQNFSQNATRINPFGNRSQDSPFGNHNQGNVIAAARGAIKIENATLYLRGEAVNNQSKFSAGISLVLNDRTALKKGSWRIWHGESETWARLENFDFNANNLVSLQDGNKVAVLPMSTFFATPNSLVNRADEEERLIDRIFEEDQDFVFKTADQMLLAGGMEDDLEIGLHHLSWKGENVRNEDGHIILRSNQVTRAFRSKGNYQMEHAFERQFLARLFARCAIQEGQKTDKSSCTFPPIALVLLGRLANGPHNVFWVKQETHNTKSRFFSDQKTILEPAVKNYLKESSVLFNAWVNNVYPAIFTNAETRKNILGIERVLTDFEEKWITIFMDSYVKATPWYTGWAGWESNTPWAL